MIKTKKTYLPQELEVWFVLPAIRRELAKEMLGRGLKQKEIAYMLNTTEAAISQYIKHKRAKCFVFNKKIKKEIQKSAENIIKDKKTFVFEIQRILKFIKKDKCLCYLHRRFANMPKKCNICK
ncbi:MAG: transcriptional regulator [Candidatus Woesearchaeota archaeon]|nr:transcriptional regulator [Candidatus Woesearchaeota archaeon]